MPRNKYHDSCVVEFHEVFGAPVVWAPAVPSAERRRLRCALLLEEVIEFCQASGFALTCMPELVAAEPIDMIEAADALADIRYVTDGAALEWGIPLEKCLREVHRSNMSKLGEDDRPIFREDGKILKGPHYTPPQIEEILELYKGVQNG